MIIIKRIMIDLNNHNKIYKISEYHNKFDHKE